MAQSLLALPRIASRAMQVKTTARESAKDRQYQQYLNSLSESELTELIHKKLDE
jgi:hypothetical protein